MAVALDISIVICAYTEKRWEETVAAVESIKNQSTPATQIIVVIDHNRALLLRAIRNISGVVIVENRKQRGLSGARNTGVEMAIGEIVGFIDDDASAAEDWLERIGAGYADQSVIGVGGAVEPIWHNARPKWFPEEFDWVVGCSYRGMPSSAATIRNPIGCNMTFRRSVFELVGGFREDIGRVGTLPVGCEETELCIRASQRLPNSKVLYEPTAKVFHHVPAERGRWSYFRSRCYSEGISKALISRYVGSRDALASERNQLIRVLPQGILRGMADTVLRQDPWGVARSGAIVGGLSATTVGFLIGAYWKHQSISKNVETIDISR